MAVEKPVLCRLGRSKEAAGRLEDFEILQAGIPAFSLFSAQLQLDYVLHYVIINAFLASGSANTAPAALSGEG